MRCSSTQSSDPYPLQFRMLSVLAIYLVATTQKIDSALHCWMDGALEQLI
jgi:hypothetical protein